MVRQKAAVSNRWRSQSVSIMNIRVCEAMASRARLRIPTISSMEKQSRNWLIQMASGPS